MYKYRIQQILRTKIPLTVSGVKGLKSISGLKVSPGTRVVVTKRCNVGEGRIRVIVDDKAHPELQGVKFTVGDGAFRETHRGRPAKLTV